MFIQSLLCLVAFASQGQTKQEKQKVFLDPATGLKFVHPATWKVENKRFITLFTLPVPKGEIAPIVEMMDSNFLEPSDSWQSYVEQAAKNSNRTLVSQWKEELLGVPLLLSKTTYTDKKLGDVTTLTGLLYSKSDHKMLFRLTAPNPKFEEVQKKWQDVLLTLSTITGDLPEPENPDRKITIKPPDPKKKVKKPDKSDRKAVSIPVERAPDPAKRKTVVLKPDYDNTPKKLRRGETILRSNAGGVDVQIFIKSGWTAKETKDGFILSNPEYKGELFLETFAKIDSPNPDSEFIKATSESLNTFQKVVRRIDSKPIMTPAGSKLTQVYREGDAKTGYIAELIALGECGDYYWVARCPLGNKEKISQQKQLVAKLLESLAVAASKK